MYIVYYMYMQVCADCCVVYKNNNIQDSMYIQCTCIHVQCNVHRYIHTINACTQVCTRSSFPYSESLGGGTTLVGKTKLWPGGRGRGIGQKQNLR